MPCSPFLFKPAQNCLWWLRKYTLGSIICNFMKCWRMFGFRCESRRDILVMDLSRFKEFTKNSTQWDAETAKVLKVCTTSKPRVCSPSLQIQTWFEMQFVSLLFSLAWLWFLFMPRHQIQNWSKQDDLPVKNMWHHIFSHRLRHGFLKMRHQLSKDFSLFPFQKPFWWKLNWTSRMQTCNTWHRFEPIASDAEFLEQISMKFNFTSLSVAFFQQ